jgi:hypothetical protein
MTHGNELPQIIHMEVRFCCKAGSPKSDDQMRDAPVNTNELFIPQLAWKSHKNESSFTARGFPVNAAAIPIPHKLSSWCRFTLNSGKVKPFCASIGSRLSRRDKSGNAQTCVSTSVAIVTMPQLHLSTRAAVLPTTFRGGLGL